jgi:RHS repeat-associated protein
MDKRIELTEYRTETSKRFIKPNGDVQIEIYKNISSNTRNNDHKETVTGLIDTYIYNGDTNVPTYNEDKILIGTDSSKTYRSLIKFDLPSIPTNYRLVDAKLCLTYYPKVNGDPLYIGPKIVAYKINTSWNASTAKWNNMSSNYDSSRIYDYIFTHQTMYDGNNTTYATSEINITKMVQDWYNGENNYGLMLKWNTETYDSNNPIGEIISSDASGDQELLPHVVLTFKNYNGVESYLSYTSQQHHFGNSHICNYTGNLTSTFNVANTVGGTFPVNLYLVYNTGSAILNEDYGYGLGYKLNLNQTLTEVDANTIEYLDEDGTIHYFNKVDDIYYDEDGLYLTIILDNNKYIMRDKNKNEMTFEPYNNIYYLTKIKDTNSKEINIEFDNNHKINRVVDSTNHAVTIAYNANSVVFTSPHKTATISLNNNLLTSITSLGDTETITYTTNNLIEKITNPNGLAIKYEYINDLTFKISKVSELSNLNNVGKYLTFEYSIDDTKITDNKGRVNTLTFNKYGNTINITNLDNDNDLTNAFGKSYVFGDDTNTKNKITVDKSLQQYVNNMIDDSSFEGETDPFTVTSSLTKSYVSDARTGAKALKILTNSSSSTPKVTANFSISSTSKPITFSFFAKGSGSLTIKLGTTEEDIVLTNSYQKYSITCTANNSVTFEMNNLNITEMIIDDIQLEYSEVPNYYNMVTNSSFENSTTGWLVTTNGPTSGQTATEDGNKCIKLHSNPEGTVTLEKSFNTSGSAGDVFNLSFWYKNEGIISTENFFSQENGVCATIFFEYENGYDGTCVPFKPLNTGTDDWQFFSENFVAEYDYSNLHIRIMSDQNANDCYLTNFSLYKDLTAYSYTYDENGNLTSTTSLSKEQSSMSYDNNNQLLSIMSPMGSNYRFEYDNYVTDRLLRTVSPTGITNEVKYDANGNPIRTRINNRAVFDELNDSYIYYIRNKGTDKYFFLNYDKSILLRESECSYSVFNIIEHGDYYVIKHVILNSYYLVSNNNEIKLKNRTTITDDMLFELEQDNNGYYTIKLKNTTKYLKVDSNDLLVLDDYDEDEEYNYQFYFEQYSRKKYIESNAEYSQDGRFIESVTDTLDNTTNYSINTTNGLTNSITDPNNISTNYTYDSKFRVTNISKDNQAVSYEYTNNNLSKITHGTKNYLFSYNEYNNPSSVAINNTTLVNNYYENNNGNLTRVLYGNNSEINYSYDDNDRLKTVTKSNDIYNNYYDNLGRVTKLSSNSDTYKYNYDFASRLSSYKYNDYETTYSYDKDNNVIAKTEKLNNHNYSYDYDYNDEKALTKITVNNKEFNYNYDYLGRLISNNINNHCNVSYEYITHGNKTSLIINKVVDGNDIYEYTYDNLYNITEIKKNNTLTNKYYYDNHSQLIKEDNIPDNITINYTYDNYGNILSKKTYTYGTTTLLDEDTYEYNNSNWQDLLTKFNNDSITYDAIGNPTSIGNKSLTWMNGRELATYSDGTNSISYKYNLNGIRTSKTVNNITTNYYLEGRKIVFEDRNGTMIYYLYNGDELLGFIYNNNTYFYHKNMFQDIIGIYDLEFNEIVTYEYDSWGVIKNITDNSNINLSIINPFRYRSYYYDNETQLYYLNSRYYNPTIGRFINIDKVITGQKISSSNILLYCDNNPINRKDYSGEWTTYEPGHKRKGFSIVEAVKEILINKKTRKQLENETQNCYSYATALYYTSENPLQKNLNGKYTLEELKEAVIADQERFNRKYREVSSPNIPLQDDEFMIAMRVTKDSPFIPYNYHFMVKHGDTWYEKVGLDYPRKVKLDKNGMPKWSWRMDSKTVYLIISDS